MYEHDHLHKHKHGKASPFPSLKGSVAYFCTHLLSTILPTFFPKYSTDLLQRDKPTAAHCNLLRSPSSSGAGISRTAPGREDATDPGHRAGTVPALAGGSRVKL